MTIKQKRMGAIAILVLLPVGGVFVLQKAKQEALNAQFRREIVASDDPEYRGLFVSFLNEQDEEISLGGWRDEELDEVVSELQIQRKTSRNFDLGRPGVFFSVESGAGDAHPETGIYLSAEGQHSYIGGARTSMIFNDQFQRYELTPASRQRLFERIQKRWGHKLRRLED